MVVAAEDDDERRRRRRLRRGPGAEEEEQPMDGREQALSRSKTTAISEGQSARSQTSQRAGERA